MAKTLQEYLGWLDERTDLIWPKAPTPAPLKATPYVPPLMGIRAVVWSVYGTLLTIGDGRLHHLHHQPLRMQIALEKTIEEFKMWYSMSRKPGAPWEYMLQQYSTFVEDARLTGAKRKGDVPEVNSVQVWRKLLDRLARNEYDYDRGFYGDIDDLALKVAYFFHANLQGAAAAPHAVETLRRLSQNGLRQGLIDDAQAFTPAQLLRALRQQDIVGSLGEFFASDCLTLSHQYGVRKPSLTLFAIAVEQFGQRGVEPREILYVTQRLNDDLAVARQFGLRTALYAADKNCCRVQSEEVRDPQRKPDRLVTDLRQVYQMLGV